ncbi:tautomerase family protein [Bradyrhizobium pachyrhizi]|uniref:tautomerase family protein n=1 Tax=Bradyrhizobium pachyrhizi TaxID=280333 RepID=UPI00067E2A07|nr:tautomerase family protein [Bradyrhizobium pachyrhizi]
MPLWHIYHPKQAYTAEDRKAFAGKITDMYATFLPRFYVGVLFHEIPESSFYVGGEPTGDFVRIVIEHIARRTSDAESQKRLHKALAKVVEPFIEARGLRWELHIDETPMELWTVNGLVPPPANSDAEGRWREENKPSPY